MDADVFRSVLAQWPSGVTVVTTRLDGAPYGMTASSFTSVSVDPPLVLVCLARSARTHDAVLAAGRFAVNILGVDQESVGTRFAGAAADHGDRFEGMNVTEVATGCPVLTESLGWLDCRLHQAYDGGDHTIVVGAVEAAGTTTARGPLLYHSRSWGRFHGAFPRDAELTDGGLAEGVSGLKPEERGRFAVDLVAAGVHRVRVGGVESAVPVLRAVAGLPAIVAVATDDEARQAVDAGAQWLEVDIAAGSAPTSLPRAGSAVPVRVRVVDGFTAADRTAQTAAAAVAAGAAEVVVWDSTGVATPQVVRDVLAEARVAAAGAELAVATSDARGLGLTNALTAANQGVRRYDTAVGGSGSTLAPPTEDTVHLLGSMGIACGIDQLRVSAVAGELSRLLGATLPGRVHRADLGAAAQAQPDGA